jgi:hypothetical protein
MFLWAHNKHMGIKQVIVHTHYGFYVDIQCCIGILDTLHFLRYYFLLLVSISCTHRLCKQKAVSFVCVHVPEKITGKDLTHFQTLIICFYICYKWSLLGVKVYLCELLNIKLLFWSRHDYSVCHDYLCMNILTSFRMKICVNLL